MLQDVYGHNVCALVMIPNLESALSGEINTLFITWCGLKSATYRSLRQQLWDITFNAWVRPRKHSHDSNNFRCHTHSHSRSFFSGQAFREGVAITSREGGELEGAVSTAARVF